MNRYDIINRFIQERGYKSFLEIGTAQGETFNRVQAEVKVSVDPDKRTNATYVMTSDEYFSKRKYHKNQQFDIVFVDGLHTAEQAYRDIWNAIEHLGDNGVIVIHDCHPTSKAMQDPFNGQHFWTGDVWKAFVRLRCELDALMYTLDYDFGCGVIDFTKKPDDKFEEDFYIEDATYDDFIQHPEWMNFTKEWRG